MSNEHPASELTVADGKDPEGPRDNETRIKAWVGEIEEAVKREEVFRREGRRLLEIYEGEEKDETPFNILYSNTETLLPALYNNTPRPVVKPRYRKLDPMPKAASDLTQGYLEFFVDTGDADAPTFDSLMTNALVQALVPGRGLTRFDYDADVEYDGDKPKKVNHEYICGKVVQYNRFCHGYAKTWSEVPWVCFTHFMSQDEIEARWKGSKLDDVKYFEIKEDGELREDTPSDASGTKLAKIHEVWDKLHRKVLFFSEGATEFLDEKDDEYKLAGFYNIPEPMAFVTKISSLSPTALYTFYEQQAEELNSLTRRIKVIIRAIKAIGFYNPMVEGIEKALTGEEGTLQPVNGLEGLGDGAALQNSIWMWPAEKLVVVLQELMAQRNEVKQVIYEVTGMSDIIRGASVASETATAQRIKSQWGGLRIKRFQKEVARYVKDCLRLAAELAFTKLDKKTLFDATGTDLPYQKDWNEAKARVDQVKQQAQQAQLMAQQPPQPGQPPAPPQPPPQPSPNDLLLLNKPIFETVLKALSSDLHRKYLIDIELNSTVDVEATEDKDELTNFLGAMAQFFAGVGPLVESGTLPWDAAKAMLLTISRRFRLGRDLDDELASMQQPANGGNAAKEAMAKVQQAATDLEKKQAAFQTQMVQGKAQMQAQSSGLKVQSMQHQMQTMQNESAAAIQACVREIKDTKTKAALEKLLVQIQAKKDQQAGDVAHVTDVLDAEHQQRMHEIDLANRDLESKRQELAAHQTEISHSVETAGLKLDAKAKAAKAAAKPAPKGK